MNVAVIPARGGSKRIPRKNVRLFAGVPMIAHPIRCAIDSGLFDRVVVSTDDEEIARVAEQYGAVAPFRRPHDLSDDHTGTVPVVAHAVEWLRDNGASPTAVCCIYATAPFVRPGDLAEGRSLLSRGDWRYVFSATTFAFPIFRAFRERSTDGLEMFFPEHANTRSQDLPEALHDAAQFYWGRPDAWAGQELIFGCRSTIVRIPRWRVQDIDTPEDWERAEVLWRVLASEPPGRRG
jgi:N-acylneuraminate cytidylyltransferase